MLSILHRIYKKAQIITTESETVFHKVYKVYSNLAIH